KLGEGGQGAVFRARQLNPARFVAVKTLTRDTERARQRFEQEARTLLRVRHPAVARFHLYERVRDEAGAPTDEYLIAMEFVDGTGGGAVFVGTREYGAPEQWAGVAVPASDVYALGGTLFHVLTGRPPYRAEGRDPAALRLAHTSDPVPDVREDNPDVPVELA